MRFRIPGAAFLAAAAMIALAAPAKADNYPIRDGTGASQTFCSKLVSGLQYPCHLLFGLNGSTPTPVAVDGSGNLSVNIQSNVLPTGAATSANQGTANGSLTSIDTKLTSQATAANQATANSSLSTIATNTAGVATAANQTSANTKLDQLHTDMIAPTPAGANVIGKVGIDHTTPGTTDAVVVSSGTITTVTNPVGLKGTDGSTIATGTNPLPATPIVTTLTTGTATSATTLSNFPVNVASLGANSFVAQWTSAGSGNSATYEGSNDNTNWIGLNCQALSNPILNPVASTLTVVGNASVSCQTGGYTFNRIRISTYVSGTATAAVQFNPGQAQIAPNGFVSTNSSGVTKILISDATANNNGNGSINFKLISAATTNATSVKGASAKLLGGQISNTTASYKYVKFYNKASAPTVGTDTPVFTLGIPPNSSIGVENIVGFYGASFSLGLAMAVTGGSADSDTAAVALSDVIVNLIYV